MKLTNLNGSLFRNEFVEKVEASDIVFGCLVFSWF